MRIKRLLKQIIKLLTNFITFLKNWLQNLDIILEEDKLTLIITSHSTLGQNKTFILSNPKLL